MCVPPHFQVSDRASLLDFIERYDFATLVSLVAPACVSHVPLLLERGNASADGAPRWGRLSGHVAEANPHWRDFDGASELLAIFHGPHAYVSPAWYQHAPAVPTWNYAVVHVYGRPRVIEDAGRASAVLDALVAKHESGRAEPWKPELPHAFRRSMEARIVAFELEIERVEAKYKLGQNRPPADRRGTLAALDAEGGEEGRALAAFTRGALGEA